MTQPQDQIDQASAQLDAEQQGITTGQFVTVEQYRDLIKMVNENNTVTKSLQGMVQRGFNTVANTVQQTMQQQQAVTQQANARQNVLDMIPEEDRERARTMMDQAQPPQSQATQPAMVDNYVNQNVELRQWVQARGVDPDKLPGSVWQIANDASRTDEQREAAFMDEVYRFKFKGQQPAQRQRSSQQRQQQPNGQRQKANPPVEGGSGQGAANNSIEQLRNQYIKGSIQTEEYRTKANALGFNV
jgi:hypothetical protein